MFAIALIQAGFTFSHTPEGDSILSLVCLPSPVSSQMLLNGRPSQDHISFRGRIGTPPETSAIAPRAPRAVFRSPHTTFLPLLLLPVVGVSQRRGWCFGNFVAFAWIPRGEEREPAYPDSHIYYFSVGLAGLLWPGARSPRVTMPAPSVSYPRKVPQSLLDLETHNPTNVCANVEPYSPWPAAVPCTPSHAAEETGSPWVTWQTPHITAGCGVYSVTLVVARACVDESGPERRCLQPAACAVYCVELRQSVFSISGIVGGWHIPPRIFYGAVH